MSAQQPGERIGMTSTPTQPLLLGLHMRPKVSMERVCQLQAEVGKTMLRPT